MKLEKVIEITRIKQEVKEVEETYKSVLPERIQNSTDAINFAKALIGDEDREVFLVICLNIKNEISVVHRCHTGSLNASVVHPREGSAPQKLEFKSNFWGVFYMAKYSEEFKLKLVKEYAEGKLGYTRLALKYSVPDPSPIRRWVRAYQEFGIKALRRKQTKQVDSVQFKVDVLHFMKQTGASYQDTAIHFKMNNPSLIADWNRRVMAKGVKGLEARAKGRSSMSKKPKPIKNEKPLSREAQLERENELLRLEVAYLKKLKAFQENPDAFLEKHKQGWRSNSTKKDSD